MQFSRDKAKGQISLYPAHAKRYIILCYIIWHLFVIFFHMVFICHIFSYEFLFVRLIYFNI